MRRLIVVLLAAGVCTAAAAPPLVSAPPASIHAGEVWSAKVHARKATAVVVATQRKRLAFRIVRRRSVALARVVFPQQGRWRYGIRIGKRTRFVGAVAVLPRRLTLGEPFDIVEERPGSYLIADRTRNAVFRLRGKNLSRVARVAGARDLEPTANGRVLVASGRNVVALDPSTGRVETIARAENDVLGIATMPDGAIVISDNGSRLVRFGDDRTEVLLTGLEGVHGLLSTASGLVICESSTGRVLRRAASGRVEVLANGLSLPSFAAARSGSLYVSEFGSGEISRIPGTAVAKVPAPAGISVASDGKLLVASLTGRVARVDPATGKVAWLY